MECINLIKLTTSEYFMAKELKLKTYKLDNGFHISELDREDLHARYHAEIEKRRRSTVAHKYLKAWK